MSWLKPVLLCLTLAVAACGFEPVYGPGGAGTALQNRVQVDPPRDRDGFLLVQRLEERLGRAGDPAYRLAIQLNLRQEERAIDPDGDIRRFHLIGGAVYTLIDVGTGAVVQSDRVDSFVGYSATGTTVATLAAQRDAQARLMTILADQIVVQLQASSL
ncbi:LPS assembly lipoprotein LptE [uncultured Tateyamaria sp.]|uniref:LPS assembly lipoprotein LptE n=1 Tax=uncultured Tateyamaria sp. TaxID=455651 RepID=UPI0026312202|nr:LPS assembly lipoprotein LptE [uncultured Tateyamaria sp.]